MEMTVENPHLLRCPQFTLRTLLTAVAACGALFALMTYLGAFWSTVIGWFVLLVLAHVAGNAVGTRLRGNRSTPPDDGPQSICAVEPFDRAGKQSCGPLLMQASPRLSESIRIGPAMIATTVVGAVSGSTTGLYLLLLVQRERMGPAEFTVGGLSFAVLGGFFGFLTSSFLEVFFRALRQATIGHLSDAVHGR